MNQLVPASLEGEILTTVTVVGFTHPLRQERVVAELPAGGTIRELIAEASKGARDTAIPHDLLVRVSNPTEGPVVYPEDTWDRVRPKPGTLVSFLPRVRGENINSILMIAVAVAAMIIAPYAAGAFFAAGTFLYAATAAVVSSAILMGGMWAVNTLFPPRPPELEKGDDRGGKPLNSISGGSNAINKYGAIPAPLGTHRFYPPFGTVPYTELKGQDVYLRCVVIWGVGPHEVTDIKIGETLLTEFEDVETEQLNGYEDDDPLTFIPKDVFEEQLSIQLDSNDLDDPVRTTQPNTDEVSVEILAPQGIFEINEDNGNRMARTVSATFSYRPTGVGAYTDFGTITIRRALNPTRRGLRFKFPARGQYDIKVNKAGAEEDRPEVADTLIWSIIRSTTNVHPISFPKPLCLTAFRIRATDQLSGGLQTINGIVSPKHKAFNGTIWEEDKKSRNPADIFVYVLQGPSQGRPKEDDEIDWPTIERWWDFCRRKKFYYDAVKDGFVGTHDVLADVAAAGCGVPRLNDGKWSVSWDGDSEDIVQHFTRTNSWGVGFNRDFIEEMHGWRIPFINRNKDYVQDELTVYDDGYTVHNATKFEQMEFPGVTDPEQIYVLGRRHIAQIRLRPDETTFVTDWEQLLCTRGDRIYFSSDVLRIGLTSGRVKGSGSIGADQYVDLEGTVAMAAGKDYVLRFRKSATGESVLRSIVGVVGEVSRVMLFGTGQLPAAGDLFMFGEAGSESGIFRIKDIAQQEGESGKMFATITIMDDAPGIDLAASGEIPDFDSNISTPVDPLSYGPTDLQIMEWIEASGLSSLARLNWSVPRFGNTVLFQVQRRDDDAGEGWRDFTTEVPPSTSVVIPIETPGNWSFRVRSIFENGKRSAWVTREFVLLQGLMIPPRDISNLRRTYVSGNSTLDWDEIIDPRPIRYEVRRGPVVETAMTVADQITQPRYATVGDGIYWVAGYVLGGFGDKIYTASWASAELNGSVLTKNILVEFDEQGDGFPGSLEGGIVTSGLIRSDGSPLVSGWATEIADAIGVSAENGRLWVYLSPHTVNVGRVASCPVSINWDGAGIVVGDDFLSLESLFDPLITDFLGQASSRFIRVIPVIRVSLSEGDADVFAEADVFAPTDVFGGAGYDPWRPFSPGEYKGRLIQVGLVGVSSSPDVDVVCPVARWLVDVPDRPDHYTNLAVPDTGYDIVFRPDGSSVDAPFNGGPRGEALPHVSTTIINPTPGDEVRITGLTLAGCTVEVWNGGVQVARTGVYVDVIGY